LSQWLSWLRYKMRFVFLTQTWIFRIFLMIQGIVKK
jgi:hypothetical protein